MLKAREAEVAEWWKSSRFQYTKRKYSAKDVASLRGTININYPVN